MEPPRVELCVGLQRVGVIVAGVSGSKSYCNYKITARITDIVIHNLVGEPADSTSGLSIDRFDGFDAGVQGTDHWGSMAVRASISA